MIGARPESKCKNMAGYYSITVTIAVVMQMEEAMH
jgi:hypothetical protein